MLRTLYELTMDYAAATGCACEVKEGNCQATLSVEGLTIQIGLVESSSMIVLQTGVALLPTDTANRDAFHPSRGCCMCDPGEKESRVALML